MFPCIPTTENDFFTKLFDEARANITQEQAAFEPIKDQYEAVMAQVKEIIDSITDAASATKAAADIPALEHALTSKKEARAMLTAKTKELGLTWNTKAKEYQAAEAEG